MNTKFDSIAFRFAILTLLIMAAGYYFQPVWDIDSWWHIAAGRFIAETGALPSSDPFGVYENIKSQTNLIGSWLGQLALYEAFKAGDLKGLISLRTILLLLCLITIIVRCRGQKENRLLAVLLLFLVAMTLRGYTADRPQLFSFLFFATMIVLLEEFRFRGRLWALYLTPLLLLLWANFHPGAVLGLVFLFAFGTLYFIEILLGKDLSTRLNEIKHLSVVVLASTVAASLTPNGLGNFKTVIWTQTSPVIDRVSEYQSPLSLILNQSASPSIYFYVVICAIALFILFPLYKKKRFVEAGLVAFITLLSFDAHRYIPFMVIYTVPVIIGVAIGQLDRLPGQHRPWFFNGLSLIFLLLLTFNTVNGTAFRAGLNSDRFPVQFSSIVEEHGLQGRIFNSMNWGGYLIWHNLPAIRVFIDSRFLDEWRIVQYTHILWMTKEGRQFFDQGNFDMVMVTHRNPFAPDIEPYPLIGYLENHPQWRLLAEDRTGVFFVRQ